MPCQGPKPSETSLTATLADQAGQPLDSAPHANGARPVSGSGSAGDAAGSISKLSLANNTVNSGKSQGSCMICLIKMWHTFLPKE